MSADPKARAAALLKKHADAAESGRGRGGFCGVQRSGERALIEELLTHTSQAGVQRILRREGIVVADNSLGRHFRGECKCRR